MEKEKLIKYIEKNKFRMDTTYGKCWEWAIIVNDLKKFIKIDSMKCKHCGCKNTNQYSSYCWKCLDLLFPVNDI